MIQKTKKNHVITLFAVMVIVTAIASSKVKAASYEPGTISGTDVAGKTTLAATMGSGSTYALYYDPYVTAKVTYAIYRATDPYTLDDYVRTGDNTGVSSATVSFTCPTGYHSESFECYHKATKNNQSWEAYTSAVYP